MTKKKNTAQKWIGLGIIAVSVALMIWKLGDETSSVTFFTPNEVYAQPQKFIDKSFRVSGLVVQGSRKWNAESRILQFRITDLKQNDFDVVYKGMPPDLFKEGQGVVVEGRLMDQNPNARPLHMSANLLMVKHSEVYDTKKDHADLRQAKLLDSMEKNSSNKEGNKNGY